MIRERAYILISTLIMGALVLAILFAVAPGNELSRLQRERDVHAESQGSAMSVTSAALSALMYQPDLAGKAGFSWNGKSDYGSLGNLTFDPKAGSYSFNNFGGDKTEAGWNARQVPAHQVHLVGNGLAANAATTHQALVQPFRQVMVEDFNGDGQGSAPRLPWKHIPGTSGFLCTKQYMFMGSPQYQQNVAQWMMLSGPRWQDYSFDAHIAYYGNTAFGFSLRTSDGWEGYRIELQPKIGLEVIDGIDATVTAVTGSGSTQIPYPDKAQALDDPLFKVSNDLTNNPAEWTFRTTITNTSMQLSVYDPVKKDFHTVGQPWDLTKFGPDLQKAGYPVTFDKGGVGVWAQVDTGIGVSNLVVREGGSALLRIHSRWQD